MAIITSNAPSSHKWASERMCLRTPSIRSILATIEAWFHGHEPLDTDSTPNLEGEDWLMQAEGVANLDQVPEAGVLVVIGYPKFGGGVGGYARYVAVCPLRLALRCHDRAAGCALAEVG